MRSQLLIIFIFAAFSAAAQTFSFRQYTAEQGFPGRGVNTILRDQRGLMWIGTTDGLLSFDGYVFTAHSGDNSPLGAILALFEDQKGTLWIGTEKGLYAYDGRAFARQAFLTEDAITGVSNAGGSEVAICSRERGVFRFNGVTLSSPANNRFRGIRFNDVTQSGGSTLLAASSMGVVRYDNDQIVTVDASHGLPSNEVNTIERGPGGTFLIGTSKGICIYDNGMISIPQPLASLAGTPITAITRLSEKEWWFGTDDGLIRYHNGQLTRHNPFPGQGRNRVTSVLADRDGNIWLGSVRGLSLMFREPFIHYGPVDQLGKEVRSIIVALNGNVICGTSLGGASVYNGRSFSLLNKRDGFTSSQVLAMRYAPDSSLWIGTEDDGLFVFRKDQTLHYTTEDGLPVNAVSSIAFSPEGDAWLANGDKLFSPKIANDTLIHTQVVTAPSNLVIHDIIWRGPHTLLAATSDGIHSVVISNDSTTVNELERVAHLEGAVHCLVEHDGIVFAATSSGVAMMGDGGVRYIGSEDGMAPGRVYSLVFDSDGELWAGTERGVVRVSFSDKYASTVVRHFGEREGFRGGEVFRKASCVDGEGTLWFGTVNGLVRYNPRGQGETRPAPPVHVTGMKLFFEKIENTPYGDSVTSWFPLPVNLTLPYDQNNITFSFSGVDYANPEALRYRWILEGFSREWSPALTEREAVFSNLPPGSYTFRVMASAGAGWTDPASFAFTIAAPWWEWWWVRALVIAAFAVVIWFIFKLRLRQVEARNRIVQERLMLENSVLQLEQEASRLQMNPHFIFNCLNSIQGLIAAQDNQSAKRYLGRFGKLMRQILENAREELIPLSNEILMLENYLDLEQLSTGRKFEYKISCDPAIDTEATEIPPMLIQPFVENAIVHGVRRKPEGGMITVHFFTRDDVLVCEVTDNGIGREAAHALNETKSVHRSAAIGITRQRLEQYGKSRNTEAGITFIDLVNDGVAAGTKVVVVIPLN